MKDRNLRLGIFYLLVPILAIVHAATPPRGLNTWDAYRYWVTEADVMTQSKFMVTTGMASLGWQYVVVDEGWYRPDSNSNGDPNEVYTDGYSNYLPDPARFPSAGPGGERGFKLLCSKLAQMNLLCGVHVIMGIPMKAVTEKQPIKNTNYTAADIADRSRQAGAPPLNYGVDVNHPAAQEYYNNWVLTLAGWGVRFIKFDFAWSKNGEETQALRLAIYNAEAQGFPSIVLSINGDGHEYSDMYRVTDDMWDEWDDVAQELDTLEKYGPSQTPNNWADFDMIPLGRIGGYLTAQTNYTYPCTVYEINCQNCNNTSWRYRECCPRQSLLTYDEGRTLLTVLCIGRSPLMFGGDLSQTHPSVIALLTNAEALRVNSEGQKVTEIQYTPGNNAVWISLNTLTGDTYVGLFNLRDDDAATVSVSWDALGMSRVKTCEVRDIWTQKELGPFVGGYQATLLPHASAFLTLHSCM